MKHRYLVSGVVAGLLGLSLAAGCAGDPEPDTPDRAAVIDAAEALDDTPSAGDPETRLAEALAVIYADSPQRAALTYTATIADLNDDGVPDAAAYVQGPNGCAAGCDLFIFRGEGQRLEVINRLPLSHPPLGRSGASRQGWANLYTGTFDTGGATPTRQQLVFDQDAYQPAGDQNDDSAQPPLIDSLTDARPLPDTKF